jgi:hypothetical protein
MQRALAQEAKAAERCALTLERGEADLAELNDGQLSIWELHGYTQLAAYCRSMLGPAGRAPTPPPPKLETAKPRGRSGRASEVNGLTTRHHKSDVKQGSTGIGKTKGRVKSRPMDLSLCIEEPLPFLQTDIDGEPLPESLGNVLELLRLLDRNLWFQRAHLRGKHGMPVHEDEREQFDEADKNYVLVHPTNSKYRFVWSRLGVPEGIPDIAVDKGELCRCHLRRCPVCRNCTKRHCWCPGGPMDPYAPVIAPRRKRGGGTTFERTDASKDFRGSLPPERQKLYTPHIGTTRYAYRPKPGSQTTTSKYKSSKSKRESYAARFKGKAKTKNRSLSPKLKSSSLLLGIKKKPKVDNRTKWRRRLAIGGNHDSANVEDAATPDESGAAPRLPIENYVAVGITTAEAKKCASEKCILVYVPPKRTAAEAKAAAAKKKEEEEAAKQGGFVVPPVDVMPGQASYPLDKNGKPALAPGQHVDKAGIPVAGPPTHRASCHRCGNLRRKILVCPRCPHVFCLKCGEKMFEEHGPGVFDGGCVVCKEICCCGINRNEDCARKFHCYKKCPAMKKIQKKRPKGGASAVAKAAAAAAAGAAAQTATGTAATAATPVATGTPSFVQGALAAAASAVAAAAPQAKSGAPAAAVAETSAAALVNEQEGKAQALAVKNKSVPANLAVAPAAGGPGIAAAVAPERN